jgi:hypothetical protein
MALGSVLGALFLTFTALAGNVWAFALAMCAVQIFSGLVLYDAAFTSIVQAGVPNSQSGIMYLTLIAGFASTLFWPLTSALDQALGWRNTLLIYAAMNIALCLPIHLWLARARNRSAVPTAQSTVEAVPDAAPQPLRPGHAMALMVLITAGFSLTGVTLSAILSQMVPMLQALGLGGLSLYVSTLFGPAQVVIRAVNIFFGANRHPLSVTLFALTLLPLALFILVLTAPNLLGAVVFAVLVGLASGLKSIVQGTLPLAIFGKKGYGTRLGLMSGVRFVLAALAPAGFAWTSDATGPRTAGLVFAAIGVVGVLCFVEVGRRMRGQKNLESYSTPDVLAN